MPRTDAVASPGCPPLRLLSFDNLGLIKVIESSTEKGHPQVVARWGEPSSQRSIVSASLSSDEDSQVLAVARRDFNIEVFNPSSGALHTQMNVRTGDGLSNHAKDLISRESGGLVGVHLFRAEASGSRSVLTCTDSGTASLQSYIPQLDSGCSHNNSTAATWAVCKMGSILCMKVDMNEKYAAFGGDGADVTLWDIQTQSKIWEAKAPQRDSNGLMSRPFATASTFLGNDHQKLIVGTGHHQVRLYDIGARRRPMMAFDFLESPIKAVEADTDGYTVFVGTGNGDLASFDMRSGKLLGSFKGKVSGSIRSIAVHPTLPVFATCGLDRFLRVFHKSSRQLLTRVFLKQPLMATVFDTNYPIKSLAYTNGAERSLGHTSSLVAPEEGEGQQYPAKKSKKSQQIAASKGKPVKVDKDANDDPQTPGKACKKRKSLKGQLGEQPLKVHKKKGEVASKDAKLRKEHHTTQPDGYPDPAARSECKQKDKPMNKLRKVKKLKRTLQLL